MQGITEVKAIKFDCSRYNLVDMILEYLDGITYNRISEEIDQTNTPWTIIHLTPDHIDQLHGSAMINGIMYYY